MTFLSDMDFVAQKLIFIVRSMRSEDFSDNKNQWSVLFIEGYTQKRNDRSYH